MTLRHMHFWVDGFDQQDQTGLQFYGWPDTGRWRVKSDVH